jgi:HEAT repeat protein
MEALRTASDEAEATERSRLAALALGRLGALSAVPALLEALRDQREAAAPLRAAAATALGQIHAEAAARLYALAQLPDSSAEWHAASEAMRSFTSEPVIAALTEALRDSSPQVRAASAAAFLELLLDDLPNDWLASASAGSGSAEAAAPAQSPSSRAVAQAALGPLSEALKDPESAVRLQAATALGWLGDARAAGALADAMADPDERCRSAVVLALGMLGTPAALKPLALALADTSSIVRQSAAEALGQIANPVATGLLLDVLDNAEEPLEVRAAVARALGKLHFPQVMSPLQHLLEAPEPILRAAAIEAFGSLGSGRAYQRISPFLWRDPDRAVRHSAARALARLAGNRQRRARWRLRLALRVEREVRREALLILEQHVAAGST